MPKLHGDDSSICKAIHASIVMDYAIYIICSVLRGDDKSLSSMVGKATYLIVCLWLMSTTINSTHGRSYKVH